MEIKLIKLVNLIFSKNLSSSKLFVRQKEPDIEKTLTRILPHSMMKRKGWKMLFQPFFVILMLNERSPYVI